MNVQPPNSTPATVSTSGASSTGRSAPSKFFAAALETARIRLGKGTPSVVPDEKKEQYVKKDVGPNY